MNSDTCTVTVRPATMADYDVVCALYERLDVLHADAHPERFRAATPARLRDDFSAVLSADDKTLFVGELAGEVVGFADIYVTATRSHRVQIPRVLGVIDGLFVTSRSRGRGVGRCLLEAAQSWFAEHGATTIELNVYAFNTTAIAAYEAMGFQPLMVRLAMQA